MCSKMRFIPSSRHSWFCEGNACVYPMLECGKEMVRA